MPRKNAIELAEALAGKPVDVSGYVGKRIHPRKGSKVKKPGIVTEVSTCRMSQCRANRLHVKWPDGKRTYPCMRGVGERPDGSLEIL